MGIGCVTELKFYKVNKSIVNYMTLCCIRSECFHYVLECPKPSFSTFGRLYLSDNKSVLMEDCSDGLTLQSYDRYLCVNNGWTPVKGTVKTCDLLGKYLQRFTFNISYIVNMHKLVATGRDWVNIKEN